RLQQAHDLLADMSAAVDADDPAREELAIADRGPLAGAHRHIERHNIAQPHEHEAERELRDRELVDAPCVTEAHAVTLHGCEIEGFATIAIFADDPQPRERREHALRHRLKADDGGIAIFEESDQLVFVETMRDVVKFCARIDIEHFLPHGGMAVDVIGGDAETLECWHGFSIASSIQEGSRAPLMRSA